MQWLLELLPTPLAFLIQLVFVFYCTKVFGPDVLQFLENFAVKAGQVVAWNEKHDKLQQQEQQHEEFVLNFRAKPGAKWSQMLGSCNGEALILRQRSEKLKNLRRYELTDLNMILLDSSESVNKLAAPGLLMSLRFNKSQIELQSDSAVEASKWLELLLNCLLDVRTELLTTRPRVTQEQVAEKMKQICQPESLAFSADLLLKLLKEFGVFVTKGDLKIYLQRHVGKPRIDTFQECVVAVGGVLSMLDENEMFNRNSIGNGNVMSLIGLHHFVTQTQGEQQTLVESWRLLRSMAVEDTELLDLLLLSKRTFKTFLDSRIFTEPLKADKLEIAEPLDRPLTEYFISTSHNTYLMEDQIKGRSDCVAYENALRKNCRCIELDLHNGPNSDPIITHGGTMTGKIRFEDAIKTIKKFAFIASEYPLILSFENHCNVEQQERISMLLELYLKDFLYCNKTAHLLETLPSPEELKRKIVIKVTQPTPLQSRLLVSDAVSESDVSLTDTELHVSRLHCLSRKRKY